MLIQGLFTAIITPFNHEGFLDEEGLRENLRFQIQHKVDGIIVLGTTGEAPTLSAAEKKRIIEIAVEEVKGKAHVMVGTGSYATNQTIENTKLAKELGADSALVVAPYYNKPTQEGLYRHFKALCDAVDFPICVYNIQGRTGQNIQTDTLKRLAAIPQIKAVKEASGQITQMMEVLETILTFYPDFKVLAGDDALIFPLIAMGGHGACSVTSNLVPGQMKELVDTALQGDFKTARTLHYQLQPLFRGLFIETNPIPVKTAMGIFKQASGTCRLPLCEMSPENEKKLRQVLEQIPYEWVS